MILSYHWLCSLLGTDPGLDRVVERLTLSGLEVEHVAHEGAHLKDVSVAKVLSTRPHPSSKNPLTLVTIDRGHGSDPLEVVCGASNVPAPGGLVAFARLGAKVLTKDGTPFTIESRPVAGVVSQGMLCAEDELGLGSSHEGILILTDEGIAVGTALSDVPGMVDHLLTLNVTANRGDALSHRGLAREVAALLDLPFTDDSAAWEAPALDIDASSLVEVRVHDVARCPRYAAAVLRGVRVRPSPLWARVRLQRLGVRAINNVVDVTNLVMLETGHPLHAFDRDALRGHRIEVRRATPGERLATLDEVDRALTDDDLLICDGEGPVALAGVMGGARSGVTASTTDIVLECAVFDPRTVRRTARRLGMHTESSHRFERGVDASSVDHVVARGVSLFASLAGASAARGQIDVRGPAEAPRAVTLRLARQDALLGVTIGADDAAAMLTRLGCAVTRGEGTLTATIPGHRNDLHREVDLIEEVARVWGFERFPSTLPGSRGAAAGATRDFPARRRTREVLTALGFDEAIHFTFVAPRECVSLGFDPGACLRLTNPLSEERSVMRPSLLPKLVGSVAHARRHGEARVRLFEVGAVFTPGREALPDERTHVGLVMAGPRDAWLARADDVDFYDLKGVVEELVRQLGGDEAVFDTGGERPAWAHPRAWARVRVGDDAMGHLAVVHPDVVESAELGRPAVVAELRLDALSVRRRQPLAKAPPRHPSARRDASLLLDTSHPAAAVAEALREGAGALCREVTLVDRYAQGLGEAKHALTFSMVFRADERTLLDAEVDAAASAGVDAAAQRFGATRR
jgi:phenylalanyl-tRNA synthetase beta chain